MPAKQFNQIFPKEKAERSTEADVFFFLQSDLADQVIPFPTFPQSQAM